MTLYFESKLKGLVGGAYSLKAASQELDYQKTPNLAVCQERKNIHRFNEHPDTHPNIAAEYRIIGMDVQAIFYIRNYAIQLFIFSVKIASNSGCTIF